METLPLLPNCSQLVEGEASSSELEGLLTERLAVRPYVMPSQAPSHLDGKPSGDTQLCSVPHSPGVSAKG